MSSKFGLITGATLRRNDIDRFCKSKGMFEITKEADVQIDDGLRLEACHLPYSLNKKRRWELLESLPSKNQNFFYNKQAFIDLIGLTDMMKTHERVNLKLIVKLNETYHRRECFKYLMYKAVDGRLEESFWEKDLRHKMNLDTLEDKIMKEDEKLEKNKKVQNNSITSNKKEMNKKSKKGKNCERNRSNDEIDVSYTVSVPNPPTTFPFKYGVKYRRYVKKMRRKKRKELILEDYNDYADDYADDYGQDYLDDYNNADIEKCNESKEDSRERDNTECYVTMDSSWVYADASLPEGDKSEDWCFVTDKDLLDSEHEADSDEGGKDDENSPHRSNLPTTTVCLLDYLTTKKHKNKHPLKSTNTAEHPCNPSAHENYYNYLIDPNFLVL